MSIDCMILEFTIFLFSTPGKLSLFGIRIFSPATKVTCVRQKHVRERLSPHPEDQGSDSVSISISQMHLLATASEQMPGISFMESPLPRPLLIRPPNPKLPHLPTRNVRLQVDRQVKLSCEVSVKL